MRRIIAPMLFLILLAGAAAFAHAPAKIVLSYDAETHMLSVEFMHKVRDPANHFIKTVSVNLNGTEIIVQTADMQETAEGGTYVYKIPQVKPGDTIEVVLECVKGGKMKKTMEIKE